MVETLRFVRRRLPHWLVAERPYFVTIRLKGTLPKSVMQDLKKERDELAARERLREDDWTDLHRRQFKTIESVLDACSQGVDWLADPEVASVVLKNLAWLEEARQWRIYAATVMPTHLHVLLRNKGGRNGCLLEDLARFKSFSGQAANRILHRSGAFWAREDFDHWCRSPQKVESVVHDICNNPVKAGLVSTWRDWRWTRCADGFGL